MRYLRLPRKHAQDWLARYEGDDAEALYVRPRSIFLELSDDALRDLISDSLYYAEEMGPDNTGDIDYRPAARRCLAGIERAGIKFTRRGFSIDLCK